MTPFRLATAASTGAAAGVVGTLAMDMLWYRRARAGGSRAGFIDWEFSSDAESFEDVGAPAQVGRKAAAALGVDLPDSAAGITNDVVHWMTGTSWAAGGAVLAAVAPVPPLVAGLASGLAAFAGAQTILPAIGVYDPIWEDDGEALWKDASAHAVFGVATGLALGGADSRSSHPPALNRRRLRGWGAPPSQPDQPGDRDRSSDNSSALRLRSLE